MKEVKEDILEITKQCLDVLKIKGVDKNATLTTNTKLMSTVWNKMKSFKSGELCGNLKLNQEPYQAFADNFNAKLVTYGDERIEIKKERLEYSEQLLNDVYRSVNKLIKQGVSIGIISLFKFKNSKDPKSKIKMSDGFRNTFSLLLDKKEIVKKYNREDLNNSKLTTFVENMYHIDNVKFIYVRFWKIVLNQRMIFKRPKTALVQEPIIIKR